MPDAVRPNFVPGQSSRVGRVTTCLPDRGNQNLIDPLSVHINNLKPPPIPLKMIGYRWNTSYLHEHKTPKGLIGVFLFSRQPLYMENFLELLHRQHSVQ